MRYVVPFLWIAVPAALVPGSAGAASSHNGPSAFENRALSFGIIAATAMAGTVKVNPAGAQSCMNVGCLGGAYSGVFSITGTKDYVVQINISQAVLSNGQASMTVTPTPSSATMVLLQGNRRSQLVLGGTLQIGANQPEGHYSGNYYLTLEYQ